MLGRSEGSDAQRDRDVHRGRRQESVREHLQRCRVLVWDGPHSHEACHHAGSLLLHLAPKRYEVEWFTFEFTKIVVATVTDEILV